MRRTGITLTVVVGLLLILTGCNPPDDSSPASNLDACVNPSVAVISLTEPASEIVAVRLRSQDQFLNGDRLGTLIRDSPVGNQVNWESGGDVAVNDEIIWQLIAGTDDAPRNESVSVADVNDLARQAEEPDLAVIYGAQWMRQAKIQVTCADHRQAQATVTGLWLGELGIVSCDPNVGTADDRYNSSLAVKETFCPNQAL